MNTTERARAYIRNIWLWTHIHWLWSDRIRYKPGWTPAKFLLPYCTTYLLSTLLGLGIRPFSGWLWERQSRLVRLVDWALGEGHCRASAQCPLLWGSRSVW